jgi:hypothetical protein
VSAQWQQQAGAIPHDSSLVIHQGNQDIARALGDLYGTQPIAGLSGYLAARDIAVLRAEDLIGYFVQQGASVASWSNDIQTMRNLDGPLLRVAGQHTRVLLLTRTAPYLIPAFLDAGSGAWQARVPAENGRMETRPLQAVVNAQQNNFDQRLAQATTEESRQEIAQDRQQITTIWLNAWPSGWPPRPMPAAGAAASSRPQQATPDAGAPPAAQQPATANRTGKANRLQKQYRAARQKPSNQASSGARAETTSLLLQYASGLAQQRVAALAGVLGMTTQTIDTWLDGMCKQGSGKKDPSELAAAKKVVLATCLQLMAAEGRSADAQELLAAKPPVAAQALLGKLPGPAAALRSQLGDKDWNIIQKKSKGYNLLALMALSTELVAYGQAALVKCAKATRTCQELVALTDAAGGQALPNAADRISIASNDGGWKNLEASAQALHPDLTPEQREQLVEKAMAPITIPMADMVRILSHGGGSKNLEAAKAYLTELFTQRKEWRDLAQELHPDLTPEELEQQVEQAMAPFTIRMADMVKILSHDGGSKNLEAAKAYLTELFTQREKERKEWRDLAQALHPDLTPEQREQLVEQQVERAMAPFTIPMAELVGIVAQIGGSLRLSERRQKMNFQ